jgi:hypothetical protein
MKSIFDMMEVPGKLILGTNFYQEFCSQLFRQTVHILELYQQPSRTLRTMYFRDWARVPPMVSPSRHSQSDVFSDIQMVYGSLSVKGTGRRTGCRDRAQLVHLIW